MIEREMDGEIKLLVYVGPRLAQHGSLHVVDNGRTACNLPIQPHWVASDPMTRKVCRDCLTRVPK